ncbi:MAG: PH domain-containing protein [Alphaproteobacteria bacterium]|nr:PH domain-containing protein [Alphaproteobacteria bacterium]
MSDTQKNDGAQKKAQSASRKRRSSGAKAKASSRFSVDVNSMLVDGETVIEQGVISGGIYWKAIAVLIVSILVALFVVIEIGILLAVVSILMFVHATIMREILLFVLTDRRVFVRYGILQVDVVDIRFSKIESVELERMLPGYILGYANLVVMGTGNRYIVIPFIANGVQIRRRYNEMTLAEDDPKEVVVVNEKKAKTDD